MSSRLLSRSRFADVVDGNAAAAAEVEDDDDDEAEAVDDEASVDRVPEIVEEVDVDDEEAAVDDDEDAAAAVRLTVVSSGAVRTNESESGTSLRKSRTAVPWMRAVFDGALAMLTRRDLLPRATFAARRRSLA